MCFCFSSGKLLATTQEENSLSTPQRFKGQLQTVFFLNKARATKIMSDDCEPSSDGGGSVQYCGRYSTAATPQWTTITQLEVKEIVAAVIIKNLNSSRGYYSISNQ